MAQGHLDNPHSNTGFFFFLIDQEQEVGGEGKDFTEQF